MHLMKGSWEALLAIEKEADHAVEVATEQADPSEATVSLLFAIEARLKMLAIVLRDTVRPIGTWRKDLPPEEEEESDRPKD